MSYVFVWDSMRIGLSNNFFFKTIGSTYLGRGFTLSNFVMISDNSECVLLDLPFGNAIVGELHLVNKKGVQILERFYDAPNKYNKKTVTCYYNSCGCDEDKYEKIECVIYCITNKLSIEKYIKNMGKTNKIIESGDLCSHMLNIN